MLSRQVLIIFGTLLFFCQEALHSKSCPAPCACWKEVAQCHFGSSEVNLVWGQYSYQEGTIGNEHTYYYEPPYLHIMCKGKDYNCKDLPSFDMISPERGKLDVTSCAPSILQCISDVYFPSTGLDEVLINNMTGLTIEHFKGLTQLRRIHIELTDDDTEKIIYALPDVEFIDVVGGQINMFPNMFNKSHQGQILLTLSDNHLNVTRLPDDTFNGLSRLKYLCLINNTIEDVPAMAFRGLRALETILFNTTNLKSIDSEAFLETKYLQRIALYYNSLESFPNGLLRHSEKLKSVTINNNKIEVLLGSKVFNHTSLKNLEVVNSKISILPEYIFEGANKLEQVDFSQNLIETLPPKLFWTATSLQGVNFKKNRINSVPEELFSKLQYLYWVDFSYNNISELSRNLFASNPELTGMVLDNNKITELDISVFGGKVLFKLSVASNQINRIVQSGSPIVEIAKELDLSNNNIKILEDWLVNSTYGKLNLAGNKITSIKESLMYITHDSPLTIDLRHNNISYIITDSNNPQTNKGISVFLSYNPLDCDCAVSTLLKRWHKDLVLLDFENITCANGEQLSKIKLSSLCNKKDILIGIIGSSVVGGLIILLLVITIFGRRKKIIQKIRNTFHYNVDNLERPQMMDELKTYDVFISFAHANSELVTDILLPKLENDLGQKVCVHYRDWIVGNLIPDQIIQSVESSAITMIILTEHFMESEWSYLEFRTAHRLGIQEGQPKVIVIVLEEAILRDVTLNDVFRSYILDNGYLLWSDSQLWEKMKKMLPRQGKKRQNQN